MSCLSSLGQDKDRTWVYRIIGIMRTQLPLKKFQGWGCGLGIEASPACPIKCLRNCCCARFSELLHTSVQSPQSGDIAVF
jgi:hypothetical protein